MNTHRISKPISSTIPPIKDINVWRGSVLSSRQFHVLMR